MKINLENERTKRKYLKHLRKAQGFSEATINSVEKSILLYQDFSSDDDFRTFSQSKAIRYKEWLSARRHKGNPLSVTTIYHHLRHLKAFFTWLSGQTRFKSKIDLDSVSYLTMERKKVRQALSPKPTKSPSLEYVKELVNSIDVKTEIDRRDRALISFLLLSGMRDHAIATLPLGCFDLETLEILQDPSAGVETKFGKLIQSKMLQFDSILSNHVIEWARYLHTEKLFASTDPLFPRSKMGRIEGGITFVSCEVEPVFWKSAGPIRDILKKRSEQAGLDYFKPHSFRHTAIQLAMRCCRNAEEMKAISQNFGHEFVGTTLMSYGNLDEFRVREVLNGMSFDPTSQKSMDKAAIDRMIKELERMKNA